MQELNQTWSYCICSKAPRSMKETTIDILRSSICEFMDYHKNLSDCVTVTKLDWKQYRLEIVK